MWFSELLHNSVLRASVVAWALAQLLKGVTYYVRYRRFDFQRFVGPGGMPSSHSAFVTSLATAVGIESGFDSTVFAVAFVFAGIVMYDASGIRRAAGKQAAVLNKIVDELFHERHIKEQRLKELLGHTPIEVIAGAALGVVMAIFLV